MDNSSNMAVNTTPMANQINPEHHYGLDKNKACLSKHDALAGFDRQEQLYKVWEARSSAVTS